jgi:CRP/FNR family transcriptional regulator, cyclic AMP receptor protein
MASRLPYQPLPLRIEAGHILLRQDEHTETLWEVLTGALAERSRDADGHAMVLDIAGPGDITGAPPGMGAGWEIQALCPSSVRAVGGSVDVAAVRWARRFSELATEVAWLEVPARLERRLDALADRYGVPVPGGIRIALPLTHEDLGGMIGSSRESVSRAMGDLRAAGRVRSGGRGRIVVTRPLHLLEVRGR